MRKEKGITLVALIITIVLMVILVGVSISVVINSGIIDQTKKATSKWKEEEEKEQLAMLGQELRITMASAGNQIEEESVKTKVKELFGETAEIKDNTDYKENTYYVMGAEGEKNYILDENGNVIEATDLITMLDAIKYYIEGPYASNGRATMRNHSYYTMQTINRDIEESDEKLRTALGDVAEVYDTTKYRLVIKPRPRSNPSSYKGRIMCYPDGNMSKETIKLCEKLGIYLWGDVTEDGVVNIEDMDYLEEHYPAIDALGIKHKLFIVADVNSTAALNRVDYLDCTLFSSFLTSRYKTKLEKIKEEMSNIIERKTAEGITKESMQAKTESEMRVYIPSYHIGDYQFRLEIIRGNLFAIQDESMRWRYQIAACQEKGVPMLGDVTGDYAVTEEDKAMVLAYANHEGELTENQQLVADVSGDGFVTSEDVNLIQNMIDGTY